LGFDGTNYFVAWTEYRNGFYTDIYGARLTPAGAVLDPSGIAVSAAADNQQDPAIAFGGANFLVAWTDRRNGSPDVFAARVTPGGLTLDPSGIALSTPADMQRYPTVAFDGGDFVVTWEDERGGLIDLSGARVTAAGAVLDTGPVITQEGSQCFPALACAAAGPPLLAYQGWAGVVGGKTYNADRIWGKLNPSPGVEETENREVRREDAGATIVRGVLTLGTATGFPRGNRMAVPQPVLLDATGRKVMTLAPGANDVRQLAPGVYFVRQDSGLGKIMIAR
jgi:hypothetical protein